MPAAAIFCPHRHRKLLFGFAAGVTVFAPALPTASQTQTPAPLEQVIVSASRVAEPGQLLALPWDQIDQSALDLTGAVHINQVMQRSPGVWISRGNGQESLPALRSPVLTGAGGCGAFYMAWDGISLRAPGFCNVNQLFDVNSEQAGAIEVLRGPGTAVYGANAVHGVLNVVTADPGAGPLTRVALEGGPHDYYRFSTDLRRQWGAQALGIQFNGASDGGYKADSGFDQQKLTLRHDYDGELWQVSSALETTNLNQETAGFVSGFEAYKDPELRASNPNPEAYRDSFALRAYSHWERQLQGAQLSITPYFRRTRMTFLQHFLPWQPVEKNGQDSLGLRVALRDGDGNFNWQSGVDLDATRGTLSEIQDQPFSPNQPAGVHYDYSVDALSAAAYVQGALETAARVRLEGGLRIEYNGYDYDNRTADGSACAPTATACRFYRPADRRDNFVNGSANIGASYPLGEAMRSYLRLAHGFRPPQTSELYRLQSGQEVADLDSETIDSIDFGLRGGSGPVTYELSLYAMRKRNVIFQDADRQNVSGARTEHVGVEFSLDWRSDQGWYAGLAGNLARHRYASNANLLGARLSLEGNDIDTAPRHFGSARVGRQWQAGTATLTGELEWVRLGRYYLDPDNLHRYDGHDLLNLRLQLAQRSGFRATLRITNLLDEDYAERADFGFGSYRYFVGEPRGSFIELAYTLP